MKNYKIIILLSYISIASASAVIINPALPNIAKGFGISTGAVEWLVSIFLIGYVAGQIIYGPIAKKYGDVMTLRIGMVINIIGILICLLSPSMSMLLIGRFVTAIGASAGLVCTFIILNNSLSPHKAKLALSFATISFAISLTLATLIGGLISAYTHWYYCFYVLLLQAVIMFGASFLYDNKKDFSFDLKVSAIIDGYKDAFSNFKLVVFAMTLGVMTVFSYCYSVAGPFIAHNMFNFNSAEYSLWTSMTIIGIISGSMLIAKVINKHDSHRILIVALVCFFALLIITAGLKMANEITPLVFFVLITLMYFVCNFIYPTASHLASNAIECKSNGSAAMNFINMLTGVVAVSIMGYLPFEYIWDFLLMCAILPIICFALIIYNKF
ncbi:MULTISPECIES: multidrug effflux MFS transporter [unclassified Francisella]|uniref:multidrug effflux MFS transporter n=1 Tax=unclassified Francisella TaxID=2610885 RepID=UPI002E313C6D|nr:MULTISPECIES: multidrug effflux MFS transporter [unclassified Francisella]MED7819977.1 multidrug effflux MFS transporter [Francisella sp. 19S2-4]MED7830801.1 multidrug effflux MFS transporter [Francisella sp. 19S2-10]